jgi:AcrR family transcriptional regulator
MRTDARDNRERVLRAAREVFAEQGPRASLNRIAQRAGVGPGTLYRNFPGLQALLVAIISDDVDRLCTRGRSLLTHPSPDEALLSWLREVATHATAMRGLVASQMAALRASRDPALAACHDAIRDTGAALLARAQRDGSAPAGVDIADLLVLVNALAWASEQAPDDPALLDRLFTLATGGLLDRAAGKLPAWGRYGD